MLDQLPAEAQELLSEDYATFLAEVSSDTSAAVTLCTVQVSGLPIVKDLVENYEMEKQIKALFAEYEYLAVQMVPGRGLAFVRVSTHYQFCCILIGIVTYLCPFAAFHFRRGGQSHPGPRRGDYGPGWKQSNLANE